MGGRVLCLALLVPTEEPIMNTLLTALGGFFCLLSTALTYAAFTYMQRANDAQLACARAAGKLNALSGRVIALEGAIETLTSQHRKLSGRFYAAQGSETPASPDVGSAPAGLRKPASVETAEQTRARLREMLPATPWQSEK